MIKTNTLIAVRWPAWRTALFVLATCCVTMAWAQAPFLPTAPSPASKDTPRDNSRDSRLAPIRQASSTDRREQAFRQLSNDVDRLEQQLGIFKRVVRLVTPSVVHIEARPVPKHRIHSGSQEAGSGVIIRIAGLDCVLTNRHVIRLSSATHVRIHLDDGQEITPDKIWSDPQTDVAVMALPVSKRPYLAARLGDSDQLDIGEQLLAFGSPFGLSQSVTRGILSAKGRYNLDLGGGDVEFQNFLQTDAAINPGNSGGPLVNLRGEVIGLNTAIASSSGGNEGIGFSIPVNLALRIAKQLVTDGAASRGFLGVSLDIAFSPRRARSVGLQHPTGARVTGVEPNSPAQHAALHVDDVILKFGGVRVEDDEHLINLVKLTETGRRVEIELLRGGERLRTTAQIGLRSRQ